MPILLAQGSRFNSAPTLMEERVAKAKKKPTKKKVTATPALNTTEERQLQRIGRTVFASAADSIGERVAELYRQGADADDIAEELDLDELNDLAERIVEPLRETHRGAASQQLSNLDVTDGALFDLIDGDAAEYAAARAAELVGRKWVNGQLVDNPDARWSISQTTRDGIRDLVGRAYTDGMTPMQLKAELRSSYGFSPARAENIARTETSKASIQGALNGWRRSGLVETKESLLSDDHDVDDECDEAADDGPIPIEQDFSNGYDGPPYHPNCDCSLVAGVREPEEDDEDEEE
jgi:hypothetical protein